MLQFFKTKVKKKIYSFIYFVEYYFSWKLQGLTLKASVAFPPVNVEILVEENVYLKDSFMLCFHIICSWRQKCQSLLVSAGLWFHAGLKPNVLSVLTTPLMIYQYSSKLKDSQIIMSEMLYQFEKMRFSGKNKKTKNNEDKNSTNAKALSSQWQTNLPAWSVIKVLIISVDTQDNYFTRVSQPTYCDFLESF